MSAGARRGLLLSCNAQWRHSRSLIRRKLTHRYLDGDHVMRAAQPSPRPRGSASARHISRGGEVQRRRRLPAHRRVEKVDGKAIRQGIKESVKHRMAQRRQASPGSAKFFITGERPLTGLGFGEADGCKGSQPARHLSILNDRCHRLQSFAVRYVRADAGNHR